MNLFKHITARLVRAITSVFPKNAKRVLLLATLASLLASPEEINKETVARLQKVLKLDAEAHDLSLAFSFTKVCWEGTDMELVCNITASDIDDIRDFVSQVVPRVPGWLQYQPDAMEEDITKLVKAVVDTKTA